MKTRSYYLMVLLTLVLLLVFSGCTPTGQGEKESEEKSGSTVGEGKEAPEDEVMEFAPGAIGGIIEDPGPEVDIPDPALNYPGNPQTDVNEMVEDMMEALGYDTSQEIRHLSFELAREGGVWIWTDDVEAADGAAVKAFVRLDLGMVEMFDSPVNSAPTVLKPGEEWPFELVRSLGLEKLGYEPQIWLSRPGFMVLRKHIQLGDWSVINGNYVIRFDPETGKLIGLNRIEEIPPDDYTVDVDREAAIEAVRKFVHSGDLDPTHVDMTLVQDGPSMITDMHIYWEIASEKGFHYVRTDDGRVATSQMGPDMPIGF